MSDPEGVLVLICLIVVWLCGYASGREHCDKEEKNDVETGITDVEAKG